MSDELKAANDRLTLFTQSLDVDALSKQAKGDCKLEDAAKKDGRYCCFEGKDWRCAEKAALPESVNSIVWSDDHEPSG